MKLLITGAAGFLGRSVVATALERGHRVRAAIRPTSSARSVEWSGNPDVETSHADLRIREGLEALTSGVDAVLHLAAATSGNLDSQLSTTVQGTENLLSAMRRTGVRHIVLVSSFAVYGCLTLRPWSLLDESTPLEEDSADRDPYSVAKRLQESLVRRVASESDWRWTILRPGVIYGPGKLWTPRLGIRLKERWWVRTGGSAAVPLVFVEHCAEAVVRSAEVPAASGSTLNVVDDSPPSQRHYMEAIRKQISPRPRVVPIPWTVIRLLARLVWTTDRILFGGRLPLPGQLVPARLHALCKPLRYSNTRLREVLQWEPRYDLEEALAICAAAKRGGGTATVESEAGA